jgi:hypothetical protein
MTILALIAAIAPGLSAQDRMKPTAPGTSGDPQWQGTVRAADGRVFVTDGGLAIDAAFAKPARLPDRELPAKVLDGFLTAAHKDDFGIADLREAATGRTYMSPSGVALSATYINFLRRVVPAASLRLRMSAPREPVLVVANGKAIGVLMPVAQ